MSTPLPRPRRLSSCPAMVARASIPRAPPLHPGTPCMWTAPVSTLPPRLRMVPSTIWSLSSPLPSQPPGPRRSQRVGPRLSRVDNLPRGRVVSPPRIRPRSQRAGPRHSRARSPKPRQHLHPAPSPVMHRLRNPPPSRVACRPANPTQSRRRNRRFCPLRSPQRSRPSNRRAAHQRSRPRCPLANPPMRQVVSPQVDRQVNRLECQRTSRLEVRADSRPDNHRAAHRQDRSMSLHPSLPRRRAGSLLVGQPRNRPHRLHVSLRGSRVASPPDRRPATRPHDPAVPRLRSPRASRVGSPAVNPAPIQPSPWMPTRPRWP
jgi:hypothetical protein